MSSNQIANFASCLGKYDATLVGTNVSLDVSGIIGNSDLSLNAGYLVNANTYVMPSISNGNGISFSGWFNPNGSQASYSTPLVYVNAVNTTTGNSLPITICVSGGATPILVATYNNTSISTVAGYTPIVLNAWNFFCYTIECSGNSGVLSHSIYLNNSITAANAVVVGGYAPFTLQGMYVGYGSGAFAQQFNGKIDDYRYYNRVVTPMEYSVLYNFNYSRVGVNNVVPSVSVTLNAVSTTYIIFTFAPTSVFSYVQVTRTVTGTTQSTSFTVSAAALVLVGSSWTWTDPNLLNTISYTYVFTPYVLGNAGIPVTMTVATQFSSQLVTYNNLPRDGLIKYYPFSGDLYNYTPYVFPTYCLATSNTWTRQNINWTASASVNNNTAYLLFQQANGGSSFTTSSWQTAGYYNNNLNYNTIAGGTTTSVTGLGNIGGEWFSLQSSVALKLSSYYLALNYIGGCPASFYIVGSNSGPSATSWDPIVYHQFTSVYPPTTTPWTGTQYPVNYPLNNVSTPLYTVPDISGISYAQPYAAITSFGNMNNYTYMRVIITKTYSNATVYLAGFGAYFKHSNPNAYNSNDIKNYLQGSTWHTGLTLANSGVVLNRSNYKTGTGSLYFNGAAYAQLGYQDQMMFTTNGITIAFWMQSPNSPQSTGIISCSPTMGTLITSGDGQIFLITPNYNNTGLSGQLGIYCTYTNGIWMGNAPTIVANDNQWHHVVITWTWDSSFSSLMNVYNNGILSYTNPGMAYPNFGGNWQTELGNQAWTTGGGTPYYGYLSDLRMYDRVITPIEINALANNYVVAYNQISPASQSACQGIYGCRLLNSNCTRPIMRLRHSADSSGIYQQDFYSDIYGNLTTGYGGTGIKLYDWLISAFAYTHYAYVSIWYDQSMKTANDASQNVLGAQPIYDIPNQMLNFGYQAQYGSDVSGQTGVGVQAPQVNCYFNMPNGAYPYGGTSFTYVARTGYSPQSTNYLICGGSSYNQTRGNTTLYMNGGYQFGTYGDWSGQGSSTVNAINTAGNVVTFKYDVCMNTFGEYYLYVNGSEYYYSATYYPQTSPYYNFMGAPGPTGGNYYNGQLYFLYVFGKDIPIEDQIMLEGTSCGPNNIPNPNLVPVQMNRNTVVGISGDTYVSGISGEFAFVPGSNRSVFVDGLYVASASSSSNPDCYQGAPWGAFNYYGYNYGSYNGFWGMAWGGCINDRTGLYYSQSPYSSGIYVGGDSITNYPNYTANYFTTLVNGQTISGEWLQIQLPYQFYLTSHTIMPTNRTVSCFPQKFVVAGSNNGSNWSLVDYRYNVVNPCQSNYFPVKFTIPSPTQSYSYYRLIVMQMFSGADYLQLNQWNLAGSYTMPNITPTVSVLSLGNGMFDVSGNFNALTVVRTPCFALAQTQTLGMFNKFMYSQSNGTIYNMEPTGLVNSNSSYYTWQDASLTVGSAYQYSFIPMIGPVYGSTVITNTVAMSSPVIINYIYPLPDVQGTSVSNGVPYKVYAFMTTTVNHTIYYSFSTVTTIHVLAVAGGGAGGSYVSGGGGGGGVVMTSVTLPAGSNTIVVNVGKGGAWSATTSGTGANGSNTTVTFGVNSYYNLTAWGGGGGGRGDQTGASGYGQNGGSSGGAGYQAGASNTSGCNNWLWYMNNYSTTTNTANYGNIGGLSTSTSYGGGGGGGAGTPGIAGSSYNSCTGGNGGNGIQCFLPGIRDFAPQGVPYGNYYWGGGGGGGSSSGNGSSQYTSFNGNGGLGGGGGGGNASGQGSPSGMGDTHGINPGMGGALANVGSGGAGGENTGGGGGGDWTAGYGGGPGGSGIVIIAFPQVSNTVTTAASANSVMTQPGVSTNAYNSMKGIYGVRLLNANYYGPTICLRTSADVNDASMANFYADISGNLWSGYGNTGISVKQWLTNASVYGANVNYAYVVVLYDQSVLCSNHAYQYTTSSQPIYDVNFQLINFGYTGSAGGVVAPQTNCSLNMPNLASPVGDSSYTYITGIGFTQQYITTQPAGVNAAICSFGSNTTSTAFTMAVVNSTYYSQWYNTGIIQWGSWNSSTNKAVLSVQYASGSNTETAYLNSVLSATNSNTGTRAQTNFPNILGGSTVWNYFNGQMYYFYMFNTAIDASSRLLIEATPSPSTITSTALSPVGNFTTLNVSTIIGLVTGTSVGNGVTYNVLSFTTTGLTYTVTYFCTASTQIFVLAVGGGGGGASGGGGGGGGGGVVMMPIVLPACSGTTTQTITVVVGAGGAGGAVNNTGGSGGNTTVTFSASGVTPSASIVAFGGGYGGNGAQAGGVGGSNGGNGYTITTAQTATLNTGYNYSNLGGIGNNGTCAGGGGGAGRAGTRIDAGFNSGGDGIQCFLPGIATYAPAGVPYSTYYWGAGGGGGYSLSTTGYGTGGKGGGGGGGNGNNGAGGSPGPLGLNPGSQGMLNNTPGSAGMGGINTGSGGGGHWNQLGGAGGSGIVIIAFPQTAILPQPSTTPLNNAALSSSAYNSVRGAFATRLINTNYYGPTLLLRHPADTLDVSSTNFYADVSGNLWTGYGNTGIPLAQWLNTYVLTEVATIPLLSTFAYVPKWYDQGMDASFNSAYQYTLNSQPIYDVAYQNINFGYQGADGGFFSYQYQNMFFNLPYAAFPVGDASYTITTRLWNVNYYNNSGIFQNGPWVSAGNGISLFVSSNNNYNSGWGSGVMMNGTIRPNDIITMRYTSGYATNSMQFILNGTKYTNSPSSARTGNYGTNYIGQMSGLYLNGQMYYFYIFGSALTDADRAIIEATPIASPTLTLTPYGIFNPITISSSTGVVSGTSVSNGVNYTVISFTTPNLGYVVTYNCTQSTQISVLAVGGGGGGGLNGGGGGGGGVVMIPVTLPAGTNQKINILVGAGGQGGQGGFDGWNASFNAANGGFGQQTTVTFGSTGTVPTNRIIAYGGGYGANGGANPVQAGSCGGAGYNANSSTFVINYTSNFNFANPGGITPSNSNNGAAGGGGAGTSGAWGTNYTQYPGGQGGSGLTCGLPGICDFAPTGVPYGNYYWGGGGGGASYTNTYVNNNGNGGLGGGGGSVNVAAYNAGIGDTNGINPAGNGQNTDKAAGNGGANTGGGGGGSWSYSYAGSGGSGIVILAFPQSVVTAPTNTTLTNPALSASAYNSICGAFGTRLLNANYYGPTIMLRHSTDLYDVSLTNFYADISGNMFTQYGGKGMSVGAWVQMMAGYCNCSLYYAYVVKWYDQGMDISANHAYQYTHNVQPIYDISFGVVNFGYQGLQNNSSFVQQYGNIASGASAYSGYPAPQTNCYLMMPYASLPYYGNSFTYVVKPWNVGTTNSSFLAATGNNWASGPGFYNTNTVGHNVYGAVYPPNGNGYGNTTNWYYPGQVYTTKYLTGNTWDITAYANDVAISYNYGTSSNYGYVTPNNACIGCFNNASWFSNAQLFYLYAFNNVLSMNDQYIIESTPTGWAVPSSLILATSASYPVNVLGIIYSGVYNKPNLLSGTSVSNGVSFNVYAFMNANMAYTVTYTCTTSTQIFVLAVGGGGAGGGGGGSGGGGGGVVMIPVTLPANTNQTISITVGGGSAVSGVASNYTNGQNTLVTFSDTNVLPTPNVVAYGGAYGASGGSNGTIGASSSGAAYNSGGTPPQNVWNMNYNHGNPGGYNPGNGYGGAGGGGAGTMAGQSFNFASYVASNGGKGIQCFLPGIRDFAPTGYNRFGNYFWGGGGGGPSATNAWITMPINGNGGLGGGGGGANGSLFNAGLGDASGGINPAGNGFAGNANAGNGGANTGGGGGGAWNGVPGVGGSGIVVIAFPQTVYTAPTNTPLTMVSSTAYNMVRGAWGVTLLNANYYGPTIQLRHSADTYDASTCNFYADISGNMYTGYGNTGMSLTAWLNMCASLYGANNKYAYVVKWYDQGMDLSCNHGYMYNHSIQPIYDVSWRVVNFGYQGSVGGVAAPQQSCYLNLPYGSTAIPVGDTSYTVIAQNGYIAGTANNTWECFLGGGTSSNDQGFGLYAYDTSGGYAHDWYNYNWFSNQYGQFPANPGNVVTGTYTSTGTTAPGTVSTYVNHKQAISFTASLTRNSINTAVNRIGSQGNWTNYYYFNGQMYYLYSFNMALSDADRLILEMSGNAMPSMSLTPGGIFSAISLNTSYGVLSGTSVTSGVTYNVFAFMDCNTGYTLSYTSTAQTLIYVLAVGGGGPGYNDGGGGGGGGGVVMLPITLPSGTGTIQVSVGPGGVGNTLVNGINTTVNFSAAATPTKNIIAYGGGAGAHYNIVGNVGGSNGGYGYSMTASTTYYPSNNMNYNFANTSGPFPQASATSGGGGAGTMGTSGAGYIAQIGGKGGNGLTCGLPGIRDFAPPGYTRFGNYYWGGGGGGSSTSATMANPYSNGGLGGGGGGANGSAGSFGWGDASGGISPAGNGTINNTQAGNGGANTGGGGGGAWNGTPGNGGCGIVVIAFPQTVVSTPTNTVLTNPALSATAYTSVRGAYACELINANYYGPTMCLRYSTDTSGLYLTNFYADVSGNLWTGYGNTGISIFTWLNNMNNTIPFSPNLAQTTLLRGNPSYAYVVTWYDQGMDICFNHAYQPYNAYQPIYDVSWRVINYGYQGSNGGVSAPATGLFFDLPTGAYSSGDTSFSYITKFYNLTSSSLNMIMGAGGTTGANSNAMYFLVGNALGNLNTYCGQINVTGTYTVVQNNVVALTYDNKANTASRVLTIYSNVNGTETSLASGNPAAALTVSPSYNFIGAGNLSSYVQGQTLNGQMYYFYAFSNALTPADRAIIEATDTCFNKFARVFSYTSTSFTAINIPQYGTQYTQSVYNGITYNVVAFLSTGCTYNVPFTCTSPTVMYVLAVGGGGAGGADQAGGGGGGGVVQSTMSIVAGSDMMNITVGAGGILASNSIQAYNGYNTTVTFTGANSGQNITAYGGGAGGSYSYAAGNGGSGGGCGNTNSTTYGTGVAGQGYSGATGNGGGGGGAGNTGFSAGWYGMYGGRGGDGVKCSLPVIAASIYGQYFWGGGGGGGYSGTSTAGMGGAGGGGGGSCNGGVGGIGDIMGINPAGNGVAVIYKPGGNGGNNTGGGGGGGSQGSIASYGGSGIVIIAFA